MNPFAAFFRSVRADYRALQRYGAKYHGEAIPLSRLPADLFRKIGFQMMVAVRFMRLTRDLHLPLAPQLTSRLIRHLYGAEIHWDAQLADGTSIIHGVGLVIGHGARVGPGCILFHNVTLGESADPESRVVGTPTLEEDVHVGPGATLLGPITVGAGTKVMGGSVIHRSVPPRSVVRPAPVSITARSPSTGPAPTSPAEDP
jgi:serine acetyltransferase